MPATPATPDRHLMTLLVKPSERALLDLICDQEGGASRSAVVRKLIAQEASRRNIDPSTAGSAQPVQAG